MVVSGDAVPLFGVGLLLALALGRRPSDGAGRSFVTRLDVYLFPVLLAGFYYLKTPNLQSAARYYLPGLQLLAAALACAFDALADGLPARWLRPVTTAFVVADAALSLGFNQVRVAPILRRFKSNYWSVAQDAARFLKKDAPPGRRVNVLVEVDIGMLSFYAGDACYFFDGGALATPSLADLSVARQVERTRPDRVVETLGDGVGDLRASVPALALLWHRDFRSHSVTSPQAVYVCNIYGNRR